MNVFGIRYFLVKNQDSLFNEINESIDPKALFIGSLFDTSEVTYYKTSYTVREIKSEEHDFRLGFFFKNVATHLIDLKDDFFSEEDISNWQKLFFALNPKEQLILFQHKTTIADPENIRNVISEMCLPALRQNGYDLKLKFLIDEKKFWEIISDADGVYEISFDLNSPNLFGASKKANNWLKDVKEKFNNTSLKVILRNENARLRYDKEELEDYRSYSDDGGGEWSLGVLDGFKKRRYKSSHNVKTEELPIASDDPRFIKDRVEYMQKELSSIIKKLSSFRTE